MRTESFATPGSVALRINVPAGDVDVETMDAAETTVELEVRGHDADQIERDVRIEARPRGDGHEVVVDADERGGLFRNVEYRVRVSTPHGADLESNLASADVRGRGRLGAVAVNVASGDVDLERVASARVNSASGDVRVEEASGSVKVNTASGDVGLRSVTEGEVNVHSASGDIEVGIAKGSRLFVDAQSLSGETSSELELESGSPLEGDEGPLVELRAQTMSGDISVRRA
jgi:DUF4097 and DUF4098 domain-containing protein YvlB